MSNPNGGIQGDEIHEEMVSLEPNTNRGDVQREKEDKSAVIFQEWKLPEIPTNKVYKTSTCFPWQKKPKAIISAAGATIKVGGKEDNRVDIKLFDEELLNRLRWETEENEYNYLHLGLVQIGIVPLFGKGLDVPVICALSDTRYIKFRDGLVGGMHTNLFNGPTWCKIAPNYSVSVHDPYVMKLLTIRVQTKGLKDLMRGSENVAITFRVMFRLGNSFNHVSLNTAMSTEVFEPVPGRVLKFSGRQVKPRELQWPKSWVGDTPSGSSRQASVKDTPNGTSNQGSGKQLQVV